MTQIDENLPTLTKPAQPDNPFARDRLPDHVNAGAVAIEQERAIAEAQGKLVIAKRFPRNPYEAYERVMASCRRPGLAGTAFYRYKRGDEQISGPSIRMAEELARCWGNIDYGLRELSNRDGISEMEAYAWDLETNTISSQKFTVRHIRDTKYGGKNLTSQRDIYEIAANMGARRMRARIMAILPDDLVNAAVEECCQTLAGAGAESLADRVKKMVVAFERFGVTVKHLEEHLGHSLDKTLPDELVDMIGIHNSIRDGQSQPSEWFGKQEEKQEPEETAQVAKKAETPAPTGGKPASESSPGGNISTPGAKTKPRRGRPPKKESEKPPQEKQSASEATPTQTQAPVNASTVNPATETVTRPEPSQSPQVQQTVVTNVSQEEDLF